MPTASRTAVARPKPMKKSTAKAVAAPADTAKARRPRRSATHLAIAKELAPAVAIALLDKTEQAPGAPAPALECLAAGATPSETAGKVRVQIMFDNGAVLPVEMSTDAGAALAKGLEEQLPDELPHKSPESLPEQAARPAPKKQAQRQAQKQANKPAKK